MRTGKACLLAILMMIPISASALTPPWSEAELTAKADLIVEGKVEKPITCIGALDKNKCATKYKYVGYLKVKKVIKGTVKPEERLQVVFYQLDYGQSGCVGDQYAALHLDDQGTFYLERSGPDTFSPVHWSGVKLTEQGLEPLPKCQ